MPAGAASEITGQAFGAFVERASGRKAGLLAGSPEVGGSCFAGRDRPPPSFQNLSRLFRGTPHWMKEWRNPRGACEPARTLKPARQAGWLPEHSGPRRYQGAPSTPAGGRNRAHARYRSAACFLRVRPDRWKLLSYRGTWRGAPLATCQFPRGNARRPDGAAAGSEGTRRTGRGPLGRSREGRQLKGCR